MKKILLNSALVLTSIFFTDAALAKGTDLANLKELCVIENGEELSQTFDVYQFIDIKKEQSLSYFFLKLVNVHLLEQKYSEKVLNFSEIKALFSHQGEQGYNDLYITFFGSKTTGNQYVEVKSYPGDNPYAQIFDARNGKIVAHNADGSITLLTRNGLVNCGN